VRNFLDSAEYEQWKRRCIKQRYIAAKNPCYEEVMVTCVDFELSCGPQWNLRLVLETFTDPPIWHANISYFKQIGNETIYDKCTGLPVFEVPQDALLCVKDWNYEELDVARALLGDLMGPLIPSKDTKVLERQGFFALHWIVDANEVRQRLAERN
jgi:hypothetical protein